MDRLNEKLRALGERAHAEVKRQPLPEPPVRRVRRQRLAIAGAISALACVATALGGWLLLRPEPPRQIVAQDEWVTVGSIEAIRDRFVVYVEDHEVFVLTLGKEFVALSARSPITDDDERPQKLLFCTLSYLFESEDGGTFDRSGHSVDLSHSHAKMSSVAVRTRDGMVEVAPEQVSTNDLKRFGAAIGPPCGEWGPVVEGPPGFALATEAPPDENKASLRPTRVEVGQDAELHFAPGRDTSGLRWDVFRFDGELWQWHGIFVGGPGYRSYFDIAPLEEGAIHDIGFGGSYTMDLKIPKLVPGRYRLATYSLRPGGNELSLEERTVWHYAEFEVAR